MLSALRWDYVLDVMEKAKIGLWMLAGEFLPLARFSDRAEVRLRELARHIKGFWIGSPTAARALIILAIAACIAASAYLFL